MLLEIPQELKALRWIGWKPTLLNGKPGKLPVEVATGLPAKSNDPSTWTDFDMVQFSEYGAHPAHAGFVCLAPYLCTDLDDCLDETGTPNEHAQEILRLAPPTYTEISPSGRGLHLIHRGKKPVFGTYRKGLFELYGDQTPHFIFTTGNRLAGTPEGIAEITPAGMAAVTFYGTAEKQVKELWHGRWQGRYPSQSEADLALCTLLKKKVGNSAPLIDALFRLSHLYRHEKWDRGGTHPYGALTIAKALGSSSGASEAPAEPAAEVGPQEEEIREAITRAEADEAAEERGEVKTESKEPLPEFPQVPGPIHELAEALLPDIPYPYKVMSAVTVLGLKMAGQVSYEHNDHLEPRLYTVLIGDPQDGKSAAMEEVQNTLAFLPARCEYLLSVDSGPALVDVLCKTPRVLITSDELTDLLEKGRSTRDSKSTILSELLKLYEGHKTGNTTRRNAEVGEETRIEVANANLALLAGATPTGFEQVWIGARGHSGGLLSRFVITATATKLPAMQRSSDWEKVKRATAALEKIFGSDAYPGPAQIGIAPEAIAAHAAWWAGLEISPYRTRLNDHVLRFLQVLAFTLGADTVEAGLMQTGLAWGNYQHALRLRFFPADAYSWSQAMELKIIRAFKKYRTLTERRCRQFVSPDRGGVQQFTQSFRALAVAEVIVKVAETRKGKGVWKYQG